MSDANQRTAEPWKISEPIEVSDTAGLIVFLLIVGLPWLIGVLAILGGIVWCGLHDV
jgi:hypothetical protein